jgi:hypothetical protein
MFHSDMTLVNWVHTAQSIHIYKLKYHSSKQAEQEFIVAEHNKIVGRRSELGPPLPFSQKSGTPLAFQKLSFLVENQPKSEKNLQNC